MAKKRNTDKNYKKWNRHLKFFQGGEHAQGHPGFFKELETMFDLHEYF
jgi:hypothetical protein